MSWFTVEVGACPLAVRAWLRARTADWLAVTAFASWIIAILFTFAWYRKWGGWTGNAWVAAAIATVAIPVALIIWVGAGLTPDEHLRRMFRVRGYVLAMCVRMLLLVHLGAFLTVMAKYLTGVRDYPRDLAGWLLARAGIPVPSGPLMIEPAVPWLLRPSSTSPPRTRSDGRPRSQRSRRSSGARPPPRTGTSSWP